MVYGNRNEEILNELHPSTYYLTSNKFKDIDRYKSSESNINNRIAVFFKNIKKFIINSVDKTIDNCKEKLDELNKKQADSNELIKNIDKTKVDEYFENNPLTINYYEKIDNDLFVQYDNSTFFYVNNSKESLDKAEIDNLLIDKEFTINSYNDLIKINQLLIDSDFYLKKYKSLSDSMIKSCDIIIDNKKVINGENVKSTKEEIEQAKKSLEKFKNISSIIAKMYSKVFKNRIQIKNILSKL